MSRVVWCRSLDLDTGFPVNSRKRGGGTHAARPSRREDEQCRRAGKAPGCPRSLPASQPPGRAVRVFQARRAALGRHFYLWEEQGSSRRGPGKDVRSLDTAVQLPAAFSGTTCFGPSSGWSLFIPVIKPEFRQNSSWHSVASLRNSTVTLGFSSTAICFTYVWVFRRLF